MRSENIGASAFLKKDNPNALFTWCASHRLNLAVNSGVESSTQAKCVLGLVEETAVFLKDSYKRMDCWSTIAKHTKGYNNLKKLQLIGKTRWWSKEKAIRNLLGRPLDLCVVIQALHEIENSPSFDAKSSSAARSFKKSWLEYENILTALNLRNVLTMITPATNYLQTKGLNVSAAVGMMSNVYNELRDYRDKYGELKDEVAEYITELNSLLEKSEVSGTAEMIFKEKARHVKKKMSGEKCADEAPTNADQKYRIQVFLPLIDVLQSKIKERFLNVAEKSILSEIYSVSPENLKKLNNNVKLPNLCALSSIKNESKLKTELMSFHRIYTNLNFESIIENEIDEESEDEIDETMVENTCDDKENNAKNHIDEEYEDCEEKYVTCTGNCKNCFGCILIVLKKFNLFTKVYKRVFKLYKAILILPSTQVHCERSFSKLKIIKNRLRANLSNNNLENLMICNVEFEILSKIENNKIIDIYGQTSATLTRLLINE